MEKINSCMDFSLQFVEEEDIPASSSTVEEGQNLVRSQLELQEIISRAAPEDWLYSSSYPSVSSFYPEFEGAGSHRLLRQRRQQSLRRRPPPIGFWQNLIRNRNANSNYQRPIRRTFIDEEVDSLFNLDSARTGISEEECQINGQTEAEHNEQNNNDDDECSVCRQPLEMPVMLLCGHVFCFTCAKGLVHYNNICAQCRAEIPPHFVTNPEKFVIMPLQEQISGLLWFYKSESGWWSHAPRMQVDLEAAFQQGQATFECVFNGMRCLIDFEKSIQTFGESPPSTQQIKRVASGRFSHLGVAGLKYPAPN